MPCGSPSASAGAEEYVRERQKLLCALLPGTPRGAGPGLRARRVSGVDAGGRRRGPRRRPERGVRRAVPLQGLARGARPIFSPIWTAWPIPRWTAIFSAQVVEHLPPERIPELIRLAASKLEPRRPAGDRDPEPGVPGGLRDALLSRSDSQPACPRRPAQVLHGGVRLRRGSRFTACRRRWIRCPPWPRCPRISVRPSSAAWTTPSSAASSRLRLDRSCPAGTRQCGTAPTSPGPGRRRPSRPGWRRASARLPCGRSRSRRRRAGRGRRAGSFGSWRPLLPPRRHRADSFQSGGVKPQTQQLRVHVRPLENRPDFPQQTCHARDSPRKARAQSGRAARGSSPSRK